MKLNKEDLNDLIDSLALSDVIKTSDIPDMDLYMDQVLKFMENKLEHMVRDENDKLLTKTMINNYTKDGLLMPPKNKKYNKQHMILLILIYHLKKVLSLNDIKRLFKPILNDINTRDDDLVPLEDIYNTFLEIKESEYDDFCNIFTDRFEHIIEKTKRITKDSDKDVAELFLTVIMLSAQAEAQKRLAQMIIDQYFKEP